MNPKPGAEVRLSKRLSYVLRHNPSSIDLELDDAGWVDVTTLVKQLRTVGGLTIGAEDIAHVVTTNDKQRFELLDGRIRAAQGHSVDVELGLEPVVPPAVLWHGTVDRFLDSIMEQGLVPGSRTHVHMSEDINTARKVGERRGQPVLLTIAAEDMHAAGHRFFRSANGVWLTASVLPKWIEQR